MVVRDGSIEENHNHEENKGYSGIESNSEQPSVTIEYDISLRKRKNNRRRKRIEEINQAIAEGADSPKAIAEKLGISKSGVYGYRKQINLPFNGKKSKEERIEEINQAIADGADSLEKVAEKVKMKPKSLLQGYRNLVELPKPLNKIPYVCKRKPDVDVLIEQGESLNVIGARSGLTREWARQYINGTNQYDFWREKRKEIKKDQNIKDRKKPYSIIANQINEVARMKVNDEDKWAYETTEKYFSLTQKRVHDFWKIYNIFKRYDKAKSENKIITLLEFEKDSGIDFTQVGKIFERVGLEPMNGKWNKSSRQEFQGKKEVIEKIIYETDLSSVDIAYFMEVKPSQVSSVYFNYSVEKGIKKLKIYFGRGRKFNYRTADQIYDAIEAGFTREEVKEYANVPDKIFDYAITNREIFAPVIYRVKEILSSERKL